MFKRKRLALLLVGLFTVAGCTRPTTSTTEDSVDPGTSVTKEKVRLQVWGPLQEKPLYEKHAKEFADLNPQIEFKVDYGNVGEPQAAENILADVSTAADVFIYPDDQIFQMADKGVLAKLPAGYANKVKERDIDLAVGAATYDVDGEIYGFPVSADNGYFLVYNKKYFSEEDVKTLEGILAKTSAEHQFAMDMGDGYYALSFIQYISNISYNPLTELHTTDFNDAKSVAALQAVSDLIMPLKDKGFSSENFNGAALDDLTDANNNRIIAGITGHWNTNSILEKLGDDFGATKLPTFKVGEEEVQMGSFLGSKLVGVKSSSKYLAYALAFADYITNEAAQISRFELNGWGPTNKEAAADPTVTANIGLKALSEQAPYAIPQGKSVGGLFWSNAGTIGTFLLDGPTPDGPQTLQAALDAFVAAITTN